MVKKITIERQKKLVGSGITYFVVFNLNRSEFEEKIGKERLSLETKSRFLKESKQVFPLSNGEKVTIKAKDGSNSFFVVAFTSAGRLFSERVLIDERDVAARYVVTLKLGLFGNQFVIDKVCGS